MSHDRVVINVDGAARGNPGPAAIGAVIRDGCDHVVACISERIGIATNNQAEYRALIAALDKAIALGARRVEVRSDSELMVRQLNGQYRVKNAGLLPLYQSVRRMVGSLQEFSIGSVPREQNCEADRLANQAFKQNAAHG